MLLNAEERQPKKNLKNLRSSGQIPAVVYGHGFKSQPLVLNYLEFQKINKQISESTLLDLQIGQSAPFKVLVYDLTYEPVSDTIAHVDFYKVKMDEKLRTELELEFIGEAPAVKNLGGVLVKNRESLEIECLPGDLISEYKISLSSLSRFHDVIKISDLKIPSNITVLEDKELILVSVTEPRKEEVEPVVSEKEAIQKIEDAKKKEEEKKEEEKTIVNDKTF